MKCKIICDLLPLYIDNVCSDETKEAVEQHLDTCPECRMEYEKMKAGIIIDTTEDLDEKELLEKGKETMTGYITEKLYRRVILGDTFFNLLITVSILNYGMKGVLGGGDYFAETLLMLMPLGVFLVSDIIYWLRCLRKQQTGGSTITDTLCKASVWMKLLILVYIVATAAIVGFDTFGGWTVY